VDHNLSPGEKRPYIVREILSELGEILEVPEANWDHVHSVLVVRHSGCAGDKGLKGLQGFRVIGQPGRVVLVPHEVKQGPRLAGIRFLKGRMRHY